MRKTNIPEAVFTVRSPESSDMLPPPVKPIRFKEGLFSGDQAAYDGKIKRKSNLNGCSSAFKQQYKPEYYCSLIILRIMARIASVDP